MPYNSRQMLLQNILGLEYQSFKKPLKIDKSIYRNLRLLKSIKKS